MSSMGCIVFIPFANLKKIKLIVIQRTAYFGLMSLSLRSYDKLYLKKNHLWVSL